MADHTLSGSDGVMKALEEIARKMGGGEVAVGFPAGDNYSDGTPVAAAAFWNEFGTSTIPPRPFFRPMIAKESPTWAPKMAAWAKRFDYDGDKVLADGEFGRLAFVLDDRHAGGGDAGRIGQRQIALVAQRLCRHNLKLPRLGQAVIDQRPRIQLIAIAHASVAPQ